METDVGAPFGAKLTENRTRTNWSPGVLRTPPPDRGRIDEDVLAFMLARRTACHGETA